MNDGRIGSCRTGRIACRAAGVHRRLTLLRHRAAQGFRNAGDRVERQSSRPDFVVPGYAGSNDSLVLQPAKQTPPTFMVVASDDNLAPASAACYAKLRAAGLLVEAHITSRAGTGSA
jgi:acetyl esterase/lipase